MDKKEFKYELKQLVKLYNLNVPCIIISRRFVYEESLEEKGFNEEYLLLENKGEMVKFWAKVEDLKLFK